ncbi:MAG: sulfatase-like hydrolase/transferase [Pseudomonadota bacterium]
MSLALPEIPDSEGLDADPILRGIKPMDSARQLVAQTRARSIFDSCCRTRIGDLAVAEKVAAIVREASAPVFVFVVTMENHGPLHLERVADGDVEALYTQPPPAGCEVLTIYLRHLRNADRMMAQLRHTLEHCGRPASLCWFGDHVPIMPAVYAKLGIPSGEVEYFFWSNRNPVAAHANELYVHALPAAWLRAVCASPKRHGALKHY